MSPSVFLLAGLILLWLVFTGRASAVWDAATKGSAASTETVTGLGKSIPMVA